MHSGKYVNPVSGKTVKEKGEVASIIKELVLKSSQVKVMDLYMDCLFTSGLLIEELWKYEVYIIRMIK